MATLSEVADDLSRRLVSLFLAGPDGHRPAHGANRLLQEGARVEGPRLVPRVLSRRHRRRAGRVSTRRAGRGWWCT